MSPSSPHVLIDGVEPTTAGLAPFAVINDGHFTALQVRAYAARGVHLHVDRLASAHRHLYGNDLDPTWVRDLMRRAVADHPDAYLRVTITEHEAGTPKVMTVVRPPIDRDPRPVTLKPTSWTRAVHDVKHVGSFPQIHHARNAERAGYDDALLLTADGRISETTIANIAFLSDADIVWPDGPALVGITWQLLDQELPAHGLHSKTASVTLDDLDTYTAAVLANSLGVAPVARIGDHDFPESVATAERLDAIYRSVPNERL